MKIAYVPKRFSVGRMQMIERADEICRQYAAAGFTLTLRQVFYQFVSRGWIENRQSEYKRLGDVLNDARLAGLIDWHHMEDRTRNMRKTPSWSSPGEIVQAAADSFHLDRWRDQDYYVEVWIEKDALVGVIEPVCAELDVPYFSCRGYTSQSELWRAAMRMVGKINAGRPVRVIHLGDHDPSGMDMSRDIEDRVRLFVDSHAKISVLSDIFDEFGEDFDVIRIALNTDQVELYSPPPNPAKITDSRAGKYISRFGHESWELDALEPTVIAELIRNQVTDYIDWSRWEATEQLEREGIDRLQEFASTF